MANGSLRWFDFSMHPIYGEGGSITYLVAEGSDITGRKRAEKALQEQIEEKTRLLVIAREREELQEWIDTFDTFVAKYHPDGIMLFCNEAGLEWTGMSAEEIFGKYFPDTAIWAHSQTERAKIIDCFEKASAGISSRIETTFRGADGSTVPIIFNTQPVMNEEGTVKYITAEGKVIIEEAALRRDLEVAKADLEKRVEERTSDLVTANMTLMQEISERTRAEEALKQSEERLRNVLDGMIVFAGLLSPEGNLLQVNRVSLETFGLTPDDVLGKPFAETYWWSASDEVKKKLRDVIEEGAKGNPCRYDAIIRIGENTFRVVDFSIQPLFDESGNVVNLVISGADVTERKQAEDKLRVSIEEMQALKIIHEGIINNAPIGIIKMDSQGAIVFGNPKVAEILGLPKGSELETIGKKITDLPNVLEVVKASGIEMSSMEDLPAFMASVMPPEGLQLDIPFTSIYGKRFQTSMHIVPMFDSNRELDGVLCLLEDITERKQAENDLRDSEIKYRGLVENINDGYIVIQNEELVFANSRSEKIVGHTIEEGIGKSVDFFLSASVRAELRQRLERRLQGATEPTEYETTLIRSDGGIVPVEISVQVIQYEGKPAASMLIRDITERKRVESQREFSVNILEHLNRTGDLHELIGNILALVRDFSGCEAVGIRLQEGDDFPYFEASGFVDGHVEMENALCARDLGGEVIRDDAGNPVLECMCGNVIRGRFDPRQPFFTEGGSFWTNNTTDLLASTTEEDRQSRTRNRCNGEGYESVALIPIKSGEGSIIGLLQLNDTQRDRFTLELIEFYEQVSQSIGIVLARKQAEQALQESEERLRQTQELSRMVGWDLLLSDGSLQWSGDVNSILGRPGEKITCMEDFIKSIHPDDVAMIQHSLQEGISSETGYTSEFRFIWPDGTVHWLLAQGNAVRNDAGQATNLIGLTMDITERKRAEQLLQALNAAALSMEQAFTRNEIFAAVAAELSKLDIKCTFFRTDEGLNNMFLSYLSHKAALIKSLEKLTGIKTESFSFPVEQVEAYRQVVFERATVFLDDLQEITRQVLPGFAKRFAGQIVRQLKVQGFIAAPLIVEDEVIGVFTVQSKNLTQDDISSVTAFAYQMAAVWHKTRLFEQAQDEIVERMKIEERMRRAVAIIESVTDGILLIDLQGTVIEINKAVTDQFGYDEEGIVGTPGELFIAEQEREKFYWELERLSSGISIETSEYTIVHQTGREIHGSVSLSVMR
ncbi:MAG: PAS domain S-box protein, partial [Chloroflexota bacterium]|nr:PAS domain S-box protein [Chloroflexota bacterium]